MPTAKIPYERKKKSERLTSTSRELPDHELRIPTRANRVTDRNNVATQEQNYLFVGIFDIPI